MRLIGMLDSPYVRRVAISLKYLNLPFMHEAVSVFRHFERFTAINPVVKAPSLVLDDGTVLMDSTLMLEYIERVAAPERRLTPESLPELARSQRIIGLALAAAEKSVQIVYEHQLRPAEKRHDPWLARVRTQLAHAYRLLEGECATAKGWLFGPRPLQADITTAVVWRFSQHEIANEVAASAYPALQRLSARAEALPEWRSTPID